MKTRFCLARATSADTGVALILTLTILGLVTLLMIGFAVSMRVHSMSSRNFNDIQRARELVRGAIDEAVGLLVLNTPAIDSTTFYVTQPGRITGRDSSGPFEAPLYSSPFTYTAAGDTNDINRDKKTSPVRIFIANTVPWDGPELRVNWINIGTNGQEATSGNLIVGRYCWYVDDEATKININTACIRDPKGLGPATTSVDLRAIAVTNDMVNPNELSDICSQIHQYAQAHAYITPQEWVLGINWDSIQLSGSPYYGVLWDLRDLTAWSTELDITPWGSVRTHINNILASGPVTAIAAITNQLCAANFGSWFGGQTFAGKYLPAQIAANIVDYMDSDRQPTDSGGNPPSYLGLELTPYLNEVVISNVVSQSEVSGVGTVITAQVSAHVELWNMYPTVYATNTTVFLTGMPDLTTSPATETVNLSTTLDGPSSMAASSYAVVTKQWTIALTNVPVSSVILSPATVTAILSNYAGRLDYAVFALPGLSNAVPAAGNAAAGSVGASCNDPRVKPVSIFWNNSVAQTLGGSNANVNFVSGAGFIPGDGDISSHIHTNRDNGRLYSVGELGYIHVGNIPWRTLRLQPQPASERNANLVPDWAVLDLFTTTNLNDRVTGRVNLNSGLIHKGGVFYRTNSFLAVLAGSSSIMVDSNSYYKVVTTNIARRVWSTAGYTRPATFLPNVYNWVGEICEVKGVADYARNASGVTTNDAFAEARIRSMANLITTRSSAFNIWALAQTIKKGDNSTPRHEFHPEEGDTITGEARAVATVERVPSAGGYKFLIRTFRFIED